MQTMKLELPREEAGFTLVELMIVVAIVGVLASVAVPSFLNYQLTAKRAEAFTNLATLAKTQKTFFAEFNAFIPVPPEPGTTTLEDPTTTKRDVGPVNVAFSVVGWVPDGDVFFDYDTAANGLGGCTCDSCFTATAYGDLDGNGSVSEIVYFHPDGAGNSCPVSITGNLPPKQNGVGPEQYDMVVRHPSSAIF